MLFVDASGDDYFEKRKNQNFLRESDIERIVSTFRERRETEKFSHRASMEEIKENDFNLNIPRYVDTFEEEKPVDLDAVVGELRQIDKDMVEIDAKIAGFCKELRIEAPV